MKGLALVLWLAALTLLVFILQIRDDATPLADSREQAERSLLAIAMEEASLPGTPVALAVEEIVPVAGCSRLGVFPRRDWAENVALILMDARAQAPVVESPAVRMIEEVPVRPWRVRQVGPNAYYLLFDAWSIDELAARMTMQRDRLKRLLSITAIPESC